MNALRRIKHYICVLLGYTDDKYRPENDPVVQRYSRIDTRTNWLPRDLYDM